MIELIEVVIYERYWLINLGFASGHNLIIENKYNGVYYYVFSWPWVIVGNGKIIILIGK